MKIEYLLNRAGGIPPESLALTGLEVQRTVRTFHGAIPGYGPTPLVSLEGLARRLGVAQVLVKDESKRFGLNAFKVLGGSWAMARYLGQRLGLAPERVTFEALRAPEARERLGEITFVTATDGNHGRGVAWAARRLGHRAVVYMPAGSAPERLEHIRAQGARAEITDLNYDGAVRLAARMAGERGWVLIQDTAWPGYETVPAWIIQGYTTIAGEIGEQLADRGWAIPTHLFLQAGVGSFAGAMLGGFSAQWGRACPVTCVVEPDQADCLYRSARAGEITPVTGAMESMMAGLCCGEPCTLSWPILRQGAAAFASCEDAVAALGMRLLGRPEPGDPAIVSGESGAVGVGLLAALMEDRGPEGLRRALGLDGDSRVLCVSTEGDTDRENYRRVLEGDPG